MQCFLFYLGKRRPYAQKCLHKAAPRITTFGKCSQFDSTNTLAHSSFFGNFSILHNAVQERNAKSIRTNAIENI